MLRSLQDLEKFTIGATDGVIGSVKDIYFDDEAWTIRYLVAETGSWLSSRKVLISPISIAHADWAARKLPVTITREQVRNCPDIDTHMPVTRQHEVQYLGYYGYPTYWGRTGLWGAGMLPYELAPGQAELPLGAEARENAIAGLQAERERHRQDDPHLRSAKAVVGYHIQASDGEIGHVDDLLIDDETWAIRYLVVNTSNWWLGHQVLVAPQWIHGVDWSKQTVTVELSREAVKGSPTYHPASDLGHLDESSLYAHYGRPPYWQSGSTLEREIYMQLGMIGLGRMGSSLVSRLLHGGHDCVVHDQAPAGMATLAALGARPADSLQQLVGALEAPRAVWLMVPAAAVDALLAQLTPLLQPGDIVIDGGNSHYHDDLRRAAALAATGLVHVDVGTSGGVAGQARGHCLMVGGSQAVVAHLAPLFTTLAPGAGSAPATPGRAPGRGTADQGWLHCGPHGAGHFVKMVHNGIEYGLMAAYAEGLNILKHAGIGLQDHAVDAETTPLREPAHYRYEMDLPEIAEVWRRGSVVGSWLLDLSAAALAADPTLAAYEGRVSDSGEGRWTVQAAIDEAVPTPVLSAALYARFSSRGEADFANRLQSAMRHEFGGHAERAAPGPPSPALP